MKTADTVVTVLAGAILAFVAYKSLVPTARTPVSQRQAIINQTGNKKLAEIAQNVFTSGIPNGTGMTPIAGPLWPDTEAAYQGTWTANGPLDLATYDKQIWD